MEKEGATRRGVASLGGALLQMYYTNDTKPNKYASYVHCNTVYKISLRQKLTHQITLKVQNHWQTEVLSCR